MFKKYNSIENTYRKTFLEKIKGHGLWLKEYVVQEKVHGANLSYITTDGQHFVGAKRRGLIGEEESFYNYNRILQSLQDKFTAIWEELKSKQPDLHHLIIFGELIGGSYPHKEVKQVKGALKVQKGVFYSPDNHFLAFDILINSTHYLGVEEVNYHFEKQGILHAQTLFRGSIEDCLAYSNEFDSTIPKKLGFPLISPNICEGVIIRPVETAHFNNSTRVILKNKNEKWSEKKKFTKSIKKTDALPDKLSHLKAAILAYATDNRLNNVLSKLGEVTHQDFGQVMGLYNKDIIEDFTKDYAEVFQALSKKEQKSITKSIVKSTATLVRNKLIYV
ncbi:MAG: RNA ligase, Rnl2 family [Aureispira sp.]